MASRVLSFALAALALGGALLSPGAEASRALTQFNAEATAIGIGVANPGVPGGETGQTSYTTVDPTDDLLVVAQTTGLSTDTTLSGFLDTAVGESKAYAVFPGNVLANARNTQTASKSATSTATSDALCLGGVFCVYLGPFPTLYAARAISNSDANAGSEEGVATSLATAAAVLGADATSIATADSGDGNALSTAQTLSLSALGNAVAASTAESNGFNNDNGGSISAAEAVAESLGDETNDSRAFGRSAATAQQDFGGATTVATTIVESAGGDADGAATAFSESANSAGSATSTASNTATGGLDDTVVGTVSSTAILLVSDDNSGSATARGSNRVTAGANGQATASTVSRAEFGVGPPPP